MGVSCVCGLAYAGDIPEKETVVPDSSRVSSAECRPSDPKYASLHVIVTGIRDDRGVVRMSLYDSEENYNAKQHSCRYAILPVKNSMAEVVFHRLRPGWYAILLFHDANNNHKFDRVMGIPVERFGFSNNVRPGITGAPAFKETRFRLDAGECVTKTIVLQSLFGG